MAIPNVDWRPSPNHNARDRRHPLRGDVSHRIVGTAPSALGAFAAPGGVGSNRNASSHFIIGHRNGRSATGAAINDALCPECGPITGARGPLVIYQCVDLSRMAWTNGDVRSPTWPGYQSGVNPNLTTVTTEHEDMGATGNHIVTAHVWRASMELKRLLRSGDLSAIRAAGVRIGDGAFTAAELTKQMAAFGLNTTGYTDHHAIAGPNKPWCWRDFDGDKGFPSRLPGLLAYLSGDEMTIRTPIVTEEWMTKTGETTRFTRADGSTGTFVASERVKSVAELTLSDGTDARLLDYGPDHESLIIGRVGLNAIPGTRIEGSPIPGGTADCSVQDAKIAEQTQIIADLKTDLGKRDASIVAKNAALDAAIAHEKPHLDTSAKLAAARKA